MKLVIDKVEDHSRGIQKKYNYEVLSNAKIMEMLSSTTYSDKLLAPIRELVSNSFDSSVMAKTDKPFIITLPTNDNLEWTIRDYGISLSEDQIINLYRFYGLSDKDNSNEAIGMFGIGSKSPLAYANSFTTTSYYNGTRYVYVNTKSGDDGKPELRKILEEPTNEPNGVEISFAIRQCDISKAVTKTAQILVHFPENSYKIQENKTLFDSAYNEYKIDPVYKGKDWCITCKTSHVIMGHISYPIEINKINQKYHYLLNSGILIYMNIGDVGVNLGRESLEYTDRTIKKIEEYLERTHTEIMPILENDIEKCECYYDACIKYRQSPYPIQKLFSGVKYNGTLLSGYIYDTSFYTTSFILHYGKVRKRQIHSIAYDPKNIFVIVDVEKGAHVVIGEYLLGLYDKNKATGDQSIIIATKISRDSDFDSNIDKFCKVVGIPKSRLLFASDLIKTRKKIVKPKAYNNGPKEILSHQYNWNIGSYNYKNNYWSEKKVDLKQGGYYIQTSGLDIMFEGVKKEPKTLQYIIKILDKLGITIPTIYGLRQTHVKQAKKKGYKWINIIDWIQEEIVKLEKSVVEDDFIRYNTMEELDYEFTRYLKCICEHPDCKCGDLTKIYLKEDKEQKVKEIKSLVDFTKEWNIKHNIKVPITVKNYNKDKYDVLIEGYNWYRANKKSLPEIVKLFNCLSKM